MLDLYLSENSLEALSSDTEKCYHRSDDVRRLSWKPIYFNPFEFSEVITDHDSKALTINLISIVRDTETFNWCLRDFQGNFISLANELKRSRLECQYGREERTEFE